MIIKDLVYTTKKKKEENRFLIICGTHGNESAAIKACWHYYNKIKPSFDCTHTSYKFIFMANENAVRYDTRGFNPIDPEKSNLNRAFTKPEETFEDITNKIKDIIDTWKPDVVIDVHNSPTCANTVLIDYGPGSSLLVEAANHFGINPMVRPSQNFGTIKRYCLDKKIPAFTVETAPMFMEYNNTTLDGMYHKSVMDYLNKVVCAGYKAMDLFKSYCDPDNLYICDSDLVTKDIYCPLVSAIVDWTRDNPYGAYEKDDTICVLTDMETMNTRTISAPCKLSVQSINCPDIAFEGYALLEYSPIKE